MAAFRVIGVLVAVLSGFAIPAEATKEESSLATGCPFRGDNLFCPLGKDRLAHGGLAPLGITCYDVISNSDVYCAQDGTWTWKAAKNVVRHRRLAPAVIGAIFSGLSFLTNLLFGISDRANQDSPPGIVCPAPYLGYAGPLEDTLVYEWKAPQASDDKGITSGPSCSPESGSPFQEGVNYVQCWVGDKKGQMASCSFSVTVKVHRCPNFPWPDDGSVDCENGTLLGATCKLTCDEGYLPSGNTASECRRSGWSLSQFRCRPVECQHRPTVAHGFISCSALPVYKTYCQVSCEEGFRLRGDPTVLCKVDGTFTVPGSCEDDESPTFPSGCPPDMEEWAAPLGNLTVVSWTSPQVRDNSGSFNLTCSHDASEGFPPGRHRVFYTAADEANNKATCSFQVLIRSISCEAPSFDKSGMDLMVYDCPNGRVVGAECSVSCKSGFPLAGSSTILCDRDDTTYPPAGRWSAAGPFNPDCRVINCTELRDPLNGALACDQWGYGQVCNMFCHENYDVPIQGQGQFVCGQSSGTWRPTSDVPDCTETRQPGTMNLPSQLFYYTGNCPDPATQEQIKTNFIKILKSSHFSEKCTNVPECHVDLVRVSCGPTSTGRRKRHVLESSPLRHLAKRQAGVEILVDFSIAVPLPRGQSGSQAAPQLQSVLAEVASVLRQEVAAGDFNLTVDGQVLQAEDFAPGNPRFACEEGRRLTRNYTCAGCATGSYFNTSGCQDCPVGHYQDQGHSSSCKPCPPHTSTNGTRKSSSRDCFALCPPGRVSVSGFQPCLQCEAGTFQPDWGQSACLQCPPSSSTLTPGANSSDLCLAVSGCASSPCGNHSCVTVPGGWQCQCHGGWSGEDCGTPPDWCQQHQCQNGASCQSGLHSYSCLCGLGFRGDLCNVRIRNGAWSPWSDWTECSTTCGGGSMRRQRSCDAPPPDPDGLACLGPSNETASCNTQQCPTCPRLFRPYGLKWNCTQEQDMTSCLPGCRDDLVLASHPQTLYQCGRASNYTWNFASEDTPQGYVPECTKPWSPLSSVVEVSTEVGLECELIQQSRDQALEKPRLASQELDCVREGTCQAEVALKTCPSSRLKKRAATPSTSNITLTLTSTFPSGSINLTANLGSSDPSLVATRVYVDLLASLSRSVEQLQNNTDTFLTVEMGGQQYPPSGLSFSGGVTCPPGTVPASTSCGECPRGTYQSGQLCVLCGRGSYSDSTGSTSCMPCPSDHTTPGLASMSPSDCSPVPGSKNSSAGGVNVLAIVLPVVLGVLGLGALAFLSFKTWVKYRTRRAIGCSSIQLKEVSEKNGVPPPAYSFSPTDTPLG